MCIFAWCFRASPTWLTLFIQGENGSKLDSTMQCGALYFRRQIPYCWCLWERERERVPCICSWPLICLFFKHAHLHTCTSLWCLGIHILRHLPLKHYLAENMCIMLGWYSNSGEHVPPLNLWTFPLQNKHAKILDFCQWYICDWLIYTMITFAVPWHPSVLWTTPGI